MLAKIYDIVKYNGIGFCLWRSQYAIKKKLGMLKRKFPARRWSDIELADLIESVRCLKSPTYIGELLAESRFFFDPENIPVFAPIDKTLVIEQADNIIQNRFCYFFNEWHSLDDTPDWFLNPRTGQKGCNDKHWCDIGFFEGSAGDVKFIWEPSRFAWVYTLARAWAITKDQKYPQKFWQLIESWLDANQPNIGVNYTCGQECAIRLMAMCFGLFAFASSKSSTESGIEKLLIAIAIHADRIEKNIKFAISTRTNHSITEAAGIYTAGILFKFLKNSDRWHKLGKQIFTSECLKQIYPDGSYIQHSMNYHRLMLQDALWTLRLGRINNDSFASDLIDRVKKASEFLYQMQDDTGRVPNYGANDGAIILPLNSCDYLDYRPAIGAMHYYFTQKLLYPQGSWCEDLQWLFGNDAANAPLEQKSRQSCSFASGGYYTVRNSNYWLMTRCHSFRDRPGHADMLSVDLWWKGHNILRDSGTYMYNCDQPWQNYFGSTAAHNTVMVDGRDQMTRAGRFMWFDWVRSNLTFNKYYPSEKIHLLQAEHYGYARSGADSTVRRAILSDESFLVIVDDIIGTGKHDILLHWHLDTADYEKVENGLVLRTEKGLVGLNIFGSEKMDIFCGNEHTPAGWKSRCYGVKDAAPVMQAQKTSTLPSRFITVISFGELAKITVSDNQINMENVQVGLNDIAMDRVFDFVIRDGKKMIFD
jgi:hypothetical protein